MKKGGAMNIHLLERQALISIDEWARQGLAKADIELCLQNALPASAHERACAMTALYFDGDTGSRTSEGLYRLITAVREAKAFGAKSEQLVHNWLRMHDADSSVNRRRTLVSSALYSIWLLAILGVVVGIYKVKVLPVFNEVLNSTGGRLPRMTEFLLSPTAAESTLMILMVVGAATFSIISLILVFSLENKGQPPSWLRVIPFVRRHALHFQACEWLKWRHLLSRAISDERADELATKLSGFRLAENAKNSEFFGMVALAGACASNEAITTVHEWAHEQLERTVQQSTVWTMSLTAVLIGACVIAMYLPIFQMGKAL